MKAQNRVTDLEGHDGVRALEGPNEVSALAGLERPNGTRAL